MASARVFCDELEEQTLDRRLLAKGTDAEALVDAIQDNVIGEGAEFRTAFGPRPLVYADWVASGRALRFVEEMVQEQVLPLYANTHTSTSVTGLQSTCFRHEARQIVGESVNANVTQDVVLFTGTGCTGAVAKMVDALELHRLPSDGATGRPVVFVGPHEHHSNILPWRESQAEVVAVPEGADGRTDVAALRAALEQFADRPLKIGSFSAASNITGVLEDVDLLSETLHRHGALACFDYACAGPYVRVDMNPVVQGPARPFVYKDAVFLSPHKFVGGVGTPGVLVAKKRLLANAVPTVPGGGTVFFVSDDAHRYLSNKEEREEGGTPDIVGAVRCGLAFQVKDSVGTDWIARAEHDTARRVLPRLASHPNVVLLGPPGDTPRLPIASFVVTVPGAGAAARDSNAGGYAGAVSGDSLFLHPNFTSALLNDLFGVQSRSGCLCAGPYTQRLLGMDDATVRELEEQLLRRRELLRPGVTRVAFPYFMPAETADFVVDAIHFVAEHGWKFLPLYRFNSVSGEWKHASRATRFPERRWLGHISFDGAKGSFAHRDGPVGTFMPGSSRSEKFAAVMAAAAQELRATAKAGRSLSVGDQAVMFPEEALRLRWFLFPSEAAAALRRVHDKEPAFPTTAEASSGAGSRVAAGAMRPVRCVPGATARVEAHANGTHAGEKPRFRVYGHPASSMRAAAHSEVKQEPAAAAASGNRSAPANGSSGGDGGDGACIPCMRPRAAVRIETELAGNGDSTSLADDVDGVRAGGAEPLESKFPQRRAGASEPVAAERVQAAATSMAETSSQASLFPKPPPKLLRLMSDACMEWDMIRPGDRLLLGLSGGKDSLTLLHLLKRWQAKSPFKFEVAAATVDPGTEAFDPSPLIPYMEKLGVPYHFIREGIFSKAGEVDPTSICSYCARFKRAALYNCCRQNGYNVLVLAQHLDDLAESYLMSAFHNGTSATMRAHYLIKEGDVRVIRPLVYAREHTLKEFAYKSKLPVINENCPACFEAPKERARVKALLAQEESVFPIFNSLLRALKPLMAQEALDVQKLVNAKLDSNISKYRGIKPLRQPGGGVRKIATGEDLAEAMHSVEEHAAKQKRIQAKLDKNNAAELARRKAEGDPHGTMSQRRRKKKGKAETGEGSTAGTGENGAGAPQPVRPTRKQRQKVRDARPGPSVRGLLLGAEELAAAAGVRSTAAAAGSQGDGVGKAAPPAANAGTSTGARSHISTAAPATAAPTWSGASLAAGVALGAASAFLAQSLARR